MTKHEQTCIRAVFEKKAAAPDPASPGSSVPAATRPAGTPPPTPATPAAPGAAPVAPKRAGLEDTVKGWMPDSWSPEAKQKVVDYAPWMLGGGALGGALSSRNRLGGFLLGAGLAGLLRFVWKNYGPTLTDFLSDAKGRATTSGSAAPVPAAAAAAAAPAAPVPDAAK